MQDHLTAACQITLWTGGDTREDIVFPIQQRMPASVAATCPDPSPLRLCDFQSGASLLIVTRAVSQKPISPALLQLEWGSVDRLCVLLHCGVFFASGGCASAGSTRNPQPPATKLFFNQRGRGRRLRGPVTTQTLGRSGSKALIYPRILLRVGAPLCATCKVPPGSRTSPTSETSPETQGRAGQRRA